MKDFHYKFHKTSIRRYPSWNFLVNLCKEDLWYCLQSFTCFASCLGVITRSQNWRNSNPWLCPPLIVREIQNPPISNFYIWFQKAIFEKEWVCVGRADQVNENGKFFAGNIANEPFIVVNDNSEIRAFFNVCRHHASRLCPDGSEGCTNK